MTRPLRYSINVTLDGCCHHEAIPADEELHRHATANLERADALLFGRVTYQMMEAAFRPPIPPGRPAWMTPFAVAIDAAPKYVVSGSLARVDWNAQLLEGDLESAVRELKAQPGQGLFLGGAQLARTLTELRLIDEYEVIVHPRFAGRGPALFAGLAREVELVATGQQPLRSGAVVLRYAPRW